MEIKCKNIIHRLTMPLPELEAYYRQQRKLRFERGDKPKNIPFREACYPIFRLFLMADRLFRKQKITILNPPPKNRTQVIFACTHIFENDIFYRLIVFERYAHVPA